MGVVEVDRDGHSLGRAIRVKGALVHARAGEGHVELVDFQAADDIAVRTALGAVSRIDAALVVGVPGCVVAGRGIAALQVGDLHHIVPTGADAAGSVERRDEGVVLHEGVEGEGLAAAGDGMAVAHDGAELTGGVVGVARAVAFIAPAVVDWATGPAAPVRVVGAAVVAHLVGDDVEVPGVGVEVVGRGGGQVAADPGIEAVAEATQVGDAPGADVGPDGQEVLQVQWDAVEVGVVVPLRIEGPEDATPVVDDADVGVR